MQEEIQLRQCGPRGTIEPARTMGTGVLRETRGGKDEVLAMAVPGHEMHRTSELKVPSAFIPLGVEMSRMSIQI